MTDAMRLCEPATSRLDFPGTDLTVFVELNNGELLMTVTKANKSVYRVVLEQATMPIENAWLGRYVHAPRGMKLQTEFFQKLATQTTEQTKEFFDLSTRANQHVFEQVQAAAAKAMKPVA